MLGPVQLCTEPTDLLFNFWSLLICRAKVADIPLALSAPFSGTRYFPSLPFQMVTLLRGPFVLLLFVVLLAGCSWFSPRSTVQVFCSPAVSVRVLRVTPTAEEGPCFFLSTCPSAHAFQDSKGSGRLIGKSHSSSSAFLSFFLFATAESLSPTVRLRLTLPLSDYLAVPRCFLFSLSPLPGTAVKSHVLASPRSSIFFPAQPHVPVVRRDAVGPSFVDGLLPVPLLRSTPPLRVGCPNLVRGTSAEPFMRHGRQTYPPVHHFSSSPRTKNGASYSASSCELQARRPACCEQCHLRKRDATSSVPFSFSRAHLLVWPAAKSRTYPVKEKGRFQERSTAGASTAFAGRAPLWLRVLPETSQSRTAKTKSDEVTASAAVGKNRFLLSGRLPETHDRLATGTVATRQSRDISRGLEAFSCGCPVLQGETAAARQSWDDVRSLEISSSSCLSGMTSDWEKDFTSDRRRNSPVGKASHFADSLDNRKLPGACSLKHATSAERPSASSICRRRNIRSSCLETGSAEGRAGAFRLRVHNYRCNRASMRICNSWRNRGSSIIGDSRGFNSGAWKRMGSEKSAGCRSNSEPLRSRANGKLRDGFDISYDVVLEVADSSTRARIPGSGLKGDEISKCCWPAAVSETGGFGRETLSKRCRSNGRGICGSDWRDISSSTDEENNGEESNSISSHGHESCRNNEDDGNNQGGTIAVTEAHQGNRKDEDDASVGELACGNHERATYSSSIASDPPPSLYGELQLLPQSYRSAAFTTKQLLAAAWSRWKNLTGTAEVGTRARCDRTKYTQELSLGFFEQLRSAVDTLRAHLFARAGGKSSWWAQKRLLPKWLRGVTRRAAALRSSAMKVKTTTSGSACGGAAAARGTTAAAARIARTVVQVAAGRLVTAAAMMAKAVGPATRAPIKDPGKGCSWLLRGLPLLLPPPIPPLGPVLQGVLVLSFLADTLIFKGGLLERLAFDMLRESLIKNGKSRSDGKEFSPVHNSSRHSTSEKVRKDIFYTSFLPFCVRAAVAGLVHGNWMHLLVNLHGIRQLVPMCERLAYDAICSSKASEGNGVAENYYTRVARAAGAASTSTAAFKGWSWFWDPAAGAAEPAAAPTTVSPVTEVAQQYSRDNSTVGASKGWRSCGGWLPELSLLHGFRGREGWWARATVISLFTGGCAAGNITSFYLRRWWRRVELSMELQHRQQKLKRKLWGGIVPDTEAGDDDDDDDDDAFFRDSDPADADDGAKEQHHDAAGAAPGGAAAAARAVAVTSWDEGPTSAAAAASCGEGAAAAGARRETEAVATAFFRAFGGLREAGSGDASLSGEGEGRIGGEAGRKSLAAIAKGGGLVQQDIHKKRRKELVRRQEKAWERQLRLKKMRATQGKYCMGREESTCSSSSAESSSRFERGETGAEWKDWNRSGEEGRRCRSARSREAQRGASEEDEWRIKEEDLDEEILDETATVTDDRRWCVRTVGCSAGLYSLLGLLFGSARVGATTKSAIVKELCKKFLAEFLVPTGTDEPGHLGGFLFGYLAAKLLRW